jgi:quinol monooxygenase YgiN
MIGNRDHLGNRCVSTRMTGGALRRPHVGNFAKRIVNISDTVKVVAILTARPGKREELKALLDGMVAPILEEAGNLRYDLWQDRSDCHRFVLDELYVDQEAVASHRATPHFQNYASAVGGLADRTALALDPAAVA